MYRLYVVDAPKIFSIFWSMVSSFVEAETKAKIAFVDGPTGPGTKKTEKLLEIIDKSVLESDYGGDNPSKDRGVVKEVEEEEDADANFEWRVATCLFVGLKDNLKQKENLRI